MKALAAVALLVLTAVLSAGPAHAVTPVHGLGGALRIMDGSVPVPTEWDGVWTGTDSTYDCLNGLVLKEVSTSADTICGGSAFTQGSTEFQCNGTADATSIHVICTWSFEVFPDCTALVEIHFDATRNANTIVAVVTSTTTTTGTGEGCDLYPPNCTRIVTRGTRTGAAPTEYCLTATKRTTWGKLKILYR